MTFQSVSFFAFFAVTLLVCLLTGRKNVHVGKSMLDLASVVFYLWGFGSHAMLGLLVLSVGVLVTKLAGQFLLSGKSERGRKRVLTGAVSWHVAVLLIFKYTGFLTGGAISIGWAPLGLSFFTFQQIWYLKELYTGQFHPSNLDGQELMLFSFFFPTVSSGPIMRPGDFFPQLSSEKFLHPEWQDAAAGLYAIGIGMAKKVLIADSFGIIVNNGWAALDTISAPSAWLMILGYTLQLYFDFSGYCDMATGIARLLGLRLPVNFDSPYRALSIGEFWKRWHITLTSFLRECLYFPLGGSRKGKLRTYVNIMLIFLVSGFWHGAGWTFILWGLLHGLAQVVERLWGKGRDRLPKLLRWAMTFLYVNFCWVFFRAPSISGAMTLLRTAVQGSMVKPGKELLDGLLISEVRAVRILIPALTPWCNILLIFGLYGVGLIGVLKPGNTIRRMDAFRPTAWRALAIGLLLTWSVLSFSGIATFIYSNF